MHDCYKEDVELAREFPPYPHSLPLSAARLAARRVAWSFVGDAIEQYDLDSLEVRRASALAKKLAP